MATYEIKNLKALRSGAYTATIYRDGKRWALVDDDGRGGQPNVEPAKYDPDGPVKFWQLRDGIEKELDAYAATLPDWYLTSHGQYNRLDPSWELAIGYLLEVAENNRLAKRGGVLVRTGGGELYSVSDVAHAATKGVTGTVWNGTDWQ